MSHGKPTPLDPLSLALALPPLLGDDDRLTADDSYAVGRRGAIWEHAELMGGKDANTGIRKALEMTWLEGTRQIPHPDLSPGGAARRRNVEACLRLDRVQMQWVLEQGIASPERNEFVARLSPPA